MRFLLALPLVLSQQGPHRSVFRVELVDVADVPLHVILALDTSGSMAGAKLRHL